MKQYFVVCKKKKKKKKNSQVLETLTLIKGSFIWVRFLEDLKIEAI